MKESKLAKIERPFLVTLAKIPSIGTFPMQTPHQCLTIFHF